MTRWLTSLSAKASIKTRFKETKFQKIPEAIKTKEEKKTGDWRQKKTRLKKTEDSSSISSKKGSKTDSRQVSFQDDWQV